MAYLDSRNVSIFPISHIRGNKNYQNKYARSFSEDNVTGILKSVVDNKKFVVSYNNDILTCFINGYVIKLVEPETCTTAVDGNTLWAIILIDTRVQGSQQYSILSGVDTEVGEDSEYTGVQLIQAPHTASETDLRYSLPEERSTGASYVPYCLKILEKGDDNVWRVPITSSYKFVSSSIANIDGGTV